MSSSRAAILERLAATEALISRMKDDQVEHFGWTPKQLRAMQTKKKHTAICGANQFSGKTTANTARQSIHLEGHYPTWWEGQVWHHPIVAITASKTLDKLRDTVLKKMFGTKETLGNGWIRKHSIVEDSIVWNKGCIEFVNVRWYDEFGVEQGLSELYGFSFDQKWDRIAGYTAHDILISEECKHEWYREAWNRTNMAMDLDGKKQGQLVMDMIPILGETPLYLDFKKGRTGKRELITITIDDCTQLTEEDIQDAKDDRKDDPWVEATLYGRPVRGSGMVFTVPERNVLMNTRREDWPLHFQAIIGIDIPHTTGCFAAVKAMYDPNKDKLYPVEMVKCWDTPREVQARRIIDLGGDRIPVAWPHDTRRRDSGSSVPIVSKYKQMGCSMMAEPAYLLTVLGGKSTKSNATMDWIDDLRDRERSGRVEYGLDVPELLHERQQYSHKKGVIEDGQDDHALDALGKLIFMLRKARPLGSLLKHPGARLFNGRAPKRQREKVDFFSIGKQPKTPRRREPWN